ncbi:MAG: RnfABCDGE type electron transport complex subunit D [Paludibacter sp.]|jgi:electron transport complex protein RnfD|nr:RnfABCDGE type electron transport complex subunit D [Paludibacter sp.]
MTKLIISPSPHIHSGDSIQKNMFGVLIALAPALLMGFLFFGVGAILTTLTAIISCVLFEYLIQKFLLKGKTSITDGSAIVTGTLLAMNLPSIIPLWMVVIGSLVAIGVGKMTFGGLGNNPFNPALVGRVFMLISFPVAMTTWSLPGTFPALDAQSGATPLALAKFSDSITEMMHTNNFSILNFGIGYMGGSFGEVSAFALLLGFAFLLFRKIISWHIPVSIFATVFVFSGLLHWGDVAAPFFDLFAGGLMLGAIFMASDFATSPMSHFGQIIYGVGIGIITILIRNFGSYPEGVSFAILIMNAFTPLINTYVKPKRFGKS